MSIQPNETEWYLRDHFFRNYLQEEKTFSLNDIAREMCGIYLRYRRTLPEELARSLQPVFGRLLELGVIEVAQDGIANSKLKLSSTLERLQCVKCFYVSYISSVEARKCFRCNSEQLRDFPQKGE